MEKERHQQGRQKGRDSKPGKQQMVATYGVLVEPLKGPQAATGLLGAHFEKGWTRPILAFGFGSCWAWK